MDGCRDSDEDPDDDNDGIVDLEDSCQLGQNDWTSDSINDYDSDGCQDNVQKIWTMIMMEWKILLTIAKLAL